MRINLPRPSSVLNGLAERQRGTWRHVTSNNWLDRAGGQADKRYLLIAITGIALAVGYANGVVSWPGAYVLVVVLGTAIFGWGLLSLVTTWIVWLLLVVGFDPASGDIIVHSLILLTALLWAISGEEIWQRLQETFQSDGDIGLALRPFRNRFTPLVSAARAVKGTVQSTIVRITQILEVTVALIATLMVLLMVIPRAGMSWSRRHPIIVRWLGTAFVVAIVFTISRELLLAVSAGVLFMSVTFGLRRVATALGVFTFVVFMWGDPMWALSAAATVGVALFRLTGRMSVGVAFGFLVIAGVLVVIERPGIVDQPRLAQHAAGAAYLFLSIGVLRLIYDELEMHSYLTGLMEPFGRVVTWNDDESSPTGESAVSGSTN